MKPSYLGDFYNDPISGFHKFSDQIERLYTGYKF